MSNKWKQPPKFSQRKKIIKNMNPKDLVQIILYYISAICFHFFHKLSIWQSLQNLFWSILPPLLARYVYMYEIEHTQLYVIYSLPLRYMTVTIMRITLNSFINLIIPLKGYKVHTNYRETKIIIKIEWRSNFMVTPIPICMVIIILCNLPVYF